MKEVKKEFNETKYNNDYKRDHYDRLNFLMPKGTKERIKAAADKNGVASSEYVRQAIEKQLLCDKV